MELGYFVFETQQQKTMSNNTSTNNTVTTIDANPGPGYRFLKPGEGVKEGDEVFLKGGWGPSVNFYGNRGQSKGFLYRRKLNVPDIVFERNISPEPGWRLLEIGERIEQGSRWYFGSEWRDGCAIASPVFKTDKCVFACRVGPHPVETCGCNICETVKSPAPVFHPRIAEENLEPGESYRFLANGEVLLATDELLPGNTWVRTSFPGFKVGENYSVSCVYRRKCDEAPACVDIALLQDKLDRANEELEQRNRVIKNLEQSLAEKDSKINHLTGQLSKIRYEACQHVAQAKKLVNQAQHVAEL